MIDSACLFIFLGSILMVLNIVRYALFSRSAFRTEGWRRGKAILNLPLLLLILFLLGYISVLLWGNPDEVVAGILLGGSIFVFLVVSLLKAVLGRILDDEKRISVLNKDLRDMEQANNANAVLLTNMGHDIRTPMDAIVGYVNLSKKEDATLEQVKDYLRKIERSSLHLLSLISDILEMSRIKSGKVDTEGTPEDLHELVSGWHDVFAKQMEEKKISFAVDASGVKDSLVLCDRHSLDRVVMNLISNARKFTPDGGEVSVILTEKASDREGFGLYELRVKDNGVGMTESFASRLFEAFEQKRSVTIGGVQGMGLGMAITKRILDQMEGRIRVDSKSGVGTEFTVTLPLRLQSAMQTHWNAALPDCPVNFSGKRALVVDDMLVNREVAGMLLQNMGFQVDYAENGKDAVYKHSSAPGDYYDVILMDIQMPEMDGYEATRRIRGLSNVEQAYVPIVAMTANAFEEDIQQAFEAGMYAHVSKPINVEVLERTLAKVLGRKLDN